MRNVRLKVTGVVVLAAAAAMVAAQVGLVGFGVKESEVKARLVDAVVNGNVPVYPSSKLYNAGTAASRVAFVKDFFATARAYSETAAFKAEYAKHREGAKRTGPEAKGSADKQMSDAQAEQRKQLEETKAQVAKMPPAMQQQMKEMLKQMEEQINKQASDTSQQAAIKQVYEAQAKDDQERYKKRLAEWSADYPAQSGAVIAKRLKEFLALTADIDFGAKLEATGGGKMRFANADYESKSSNWKMCFRAGREPVAAARSLATDWLHQLGGK
jgi:hypothetical protein